MTPQTKTQTLFDRIGGEEAVARLVELFYERVLKDPELEPYFRHTSMDKLRAMQFEFFSAALDGPIKYSGQPIHYVHRGRGITTRQLSRFMDHLLATIQFANLTEGERYDMFSRINTYADSVVDGSSGDAE